MTVCNQRPEKSHVHYGDREVGTQLGTGGDNSKEYYSSFFSVSPDVTFMVQELYFNFKVSCLSLNCETNQV